MVSHIVAEGEHLSGISARYGFAETSYVYNHPSNAALKQKRPNPNQLVAGDVVEIPPLREKSVSCATDARHRFECKVPTVDLHLVLRGGGGAPLKDQPYTLTLGNRVLSGRTDGDGALKHAIPASAQGGTLKLDDVGLVVPVQVGHLDPHRSGDDRTHVITGVQARLRNLGYGCGSVDGELGPMTSAAIAEFQRHEMGRTEPDGALDDATLDALASRHGC